MSTITDASTRSAKDRREDPRSLNVSLESPHRSPIAKALTQPLASYYLILASTLLLLFIGVLMVLSSSSVFASINTGDPYYYLKRQAVFLVVGIPAAWWLSRRSERFLQVISWVGLIGAIGMLVAIFTPLGVDRFGNRSWLSFGFVEVQPSELSKAALVLWSAAVLAARRRTLDRPMRLLVPLLPVQLVVLGLVVAQKDMGTAVIVAAIMFAMLWFAGAPFRLLAALAAPLVLGAIAMIASSQTRRERVLGFLTGEGTASDQPLNAIYALASGGWWGKGLGASRQKYGGLYNGALTDYVFAVLGEEMGLFGTLAVIALFLVLGFAGFRVALRCKRPFPRLAAAGMTSWLLLQACVNIAVTMKMAPVMGVPLPFISYGGSALLANLIAVGVLLACARAEPDAAAALRDRGRKRPRVTGVVDSGRLR